MCLIFGVSYSYGITVTAKAVINDHNTSGGGTVQAHIITKEGWIWDTWTPGSKGETSSVSFGLESPKYSADVTSINNGYYFYQWEEENGTKIAQKSNSNSIKDAQITADKTVYAVFKPVGVSNASAKTISTDDLLQYKEVTVEFPVSNADNTNDFQTPIVTGDGFTYVSHTFSSNKISVVVSFTEQNKDNFNGEPKPSFTGTVTLKSAGGENVATGTINATSDLRPKYTPENGTTVDLTPGAAALAAVVKEFTITPTNNVASHASAQWTTTLASDAAGKGFAITSGVNTKAPTITFTPKDNNYEEDVTTTLTITCTYIDSQSKSITSTHTITLTADKGSAVKIDNAMHANYDFGQVTYNGSAHTHSLSFASNINELTYDWESDTYFEYKIDGENIVISLKSTAIPADYMDKLSVKSGGIEVSSLAVSAQVRLAKLELEANGDVKSVLLEWNEVYGATKYIIKSGATDVAILNAAEAQTANYKYKVTAIGSTPVVIGQSYPFTITAVYGEDASIATKISVSDEKTASPSEYPYTITTDNASKDKLGMATGLKNGLKVNGDIAKYNPSKAQWDVDVTSTFDANGNALFDRLYIFGLTTGPSGGDVQGYANAGATMPNAITPCYIYEKRSDGKAYEHKATIDNMNTETKNSTWFSVSLSSNEKKKIYLTGWCPYGSTGVTINEHGLLYVTGNNSNQIDIYLEDCYLYSRVHKRDNGRDWGSPNFDCEQLDYTGWNLLSAVNVITEDGLDYGAKGAASAIVIEATGNTAFPANIHIKGDNLVFGHMGASLGVKVDAELGGYSIKVDQTMGQYSAPIYVRPQNKDRKTTLAMDDKWLDAAGNSSSFYHTNGYLKFEKYLPAGPSIDLGNKNTILNFNGGRFELEASLPTQGNYPNNLAVCVRNGEFTYEGLPEGVRTFVCYGLAGDATGGTVNLNDGSVWVTKFTPAIKQWSGNPVDNSDFFDDIYTEGGVEYSNTLRLPGSTYVRGGSHKGYIRACSELLSSGSTPTDGYSYLEQRVYEVSEAEIENGFVKEAYFTNANPAGLYKRERVTPSTDGATEMLLETYYQTYTSYYSSLGGSYGRAAISPEVETDGKKRIYLWVPGKAKHPITFTNWHLSTPYAKADLGGLGALASGMNIEFGVETEVPYEKYEGGEDKHVVKNLWRVEMDENIVKAAKEVGKVPAKVAAEYVFVDLDDSSFPNDELYRDISNETDYVIKNSLYSFQTIQADDWMLFCPQFDVKNIYILEICDENFLKTLSESDGRDEALLAQAVLNLDMTTLIGIDISAATNDKPFWDYYARYSEYVNYIKNFTGDDSDIEKRKPFYQNYNPELNSIRTKLQHLVKKGDGSFNYSDAHYYLYQTDATDWWIDTETEILKINWALAPAAENNDGLVMKKGQVYAMQFPYCPGCNDGTEWDYWTGKMIVLEGEGPQTLNGSNVHSTIKATTEGGFHGNYTFKDISLEENEMNDAYFNVAGFMFDKESSEVTSLPAGESFVILPSSVYSSMPGKRVKSIDPQSGVITWEEDNSNDGTTTSTPTISGNRQMMVYTIDGGVGIIPVTAQQVSIYNAAGQLITSQYLTEEVQIPLPAGIYLISGEKEQAKAIVR